MRQSNSFRARLGYTSFTGVAIALLGTFYLAVTFWSPREYQRSVHESLLPENHVDDSQPLRNYNVTSRFRDALAWSPAEKFITAWTSSGWSNDVMSIVNLIYIAIHVGRTPVLPPFVSGHIGDAWPMRFGAIFDVPRLADELGITVLEWHELKNVSIGQDSEPEKLGCWSTWAMNMEVDKERPRHSPHGQLLNLGISYTPIPEHFALYPDQHWISLWKLATLSFPKSREAALSRQATKAFPVTAEGDDILEPDDQMLCFDTLYWLGLLKPEEWWDDYAPFWRTVGTHMHWNPSLLELAQNYLRRHFSLQAGEPIPPFISLHIRRGDFKVWCPPNMIVGDCFAPPSAYARRVQEVKAALRARRRGVNVQHVIVTSDERDPEWWKEIAALGPEWRWIDHDAEQTVEKYGLWYPVLLDAVFQSMGAGFVGTDRSTVTLLSQRRVEDWHGGISERVVWGAPNADDH